MALPRSSARNAHDPEAQQQNRASVWSTTTTNTTYVPPTEEEEGVESTPLLKTTDQNSPASSSSTALEPEHQHSVTSACEARNGERGICCKELKKEEATLLNPDLVRDCIIGLSDGLTVPFALTAGLSGIGSSRIVVVAGMAELVSGAISMGVGGLLSAQAELQHYRYLSRATSDRVRQSCAGEMEREVISILSPFGVPADVAGLVADKLLNVEERECSHVADLPRPVSSRPERFVRSDGLQGPSRGLTPFILRLGEGLEEVQDGRVWQSAITIGASYFIGGFIPLLPYIFITTVSEALTWSIIITGIILLLFGVAKQRFAGGATDVRGLAWGAISTLAVGASAAAASFAIVRALEGSGSG
ncbi:Uncharacterized membrane protein [Ceraceosorus bombacis]|uniref:Uncharacterized membrane protein n=1 Tax=Ceraceosorus bombacis TaxID=401625 RepID=A0A0N7LB11_9BASI|nr:Uncharacterized membrane protein [Ceraceosorus bombacis]